MTAQIRERPRGRRRLPRGSRAGVALAAVAAAAAFVAPPSAAPLAAHDIPADITVRIFIQPDGDRLRLLVRVPLVAMRDVPFPIREPGYLAIPEADEALREAAEIWIGRSVGLLEEGERLADRRLVAARASLPSDLSFRSWETALEHVAAPPLPASTNVYWKQAMLDVLYEYPIASEDSRFEIHPDLARLALAVNTVLRFVPPDGAERAFRYAGDPGVVRLDPRWHQAALTFVRSGFHHILDGIDHLLFLLCLVLPFRRLRPLVGLVTAFTVGHSLTLISAALGLAPGALWFPPLVETLIAASIVFMALENIVGAKLSRRWLVAFGFGLVHGFGFSFALGDSLQFAGSHLLTSLLAFNVGVELGQLAVLLVVVPALALLFRHVVAERMGTILLSALLAHTAWHWMTARGAELAQHPLAWPSPETVLVVLLAGVGALFALRALWRFGRTAGKTVDPAGPEAPDPSVVSGATVP